MFKNNQNGLFNVAWVEVGRPIGKYARNNMMLMRRMFPGLKQYLISDSMISLDWLEVIDVKTVPYSEKTKQFLELKKAWPHEQHYFWLGTTRRFFHLYDVMKYHGIQNVLHLETDSVLLTDAPIHDFFQEVNDFELAYPLQASGIGCASIFLIKSHEGLAKFLDFVIANWTQEGADDMTLLGEFSFRHQVCVLPSWPEKGKVENFYDAQSIGKYFLGTDARNCRLPFSMRGIIDKRNGSVFTKLLDSKNRWLIQRKDGLISVKLETDATFNKLVNVHVHSKHIPKHPISFYFLLILGFGAKIPIFWRVGLFDRYVFAERVLSFIARKLFRRKDFQEKILR